jgi:pimeloyl-ACP methyl ester carboxylesterase
MELGDAGETIVFIHGFSSSLFTWRSCLEPISKKYHVVALDLKGFGFSGKPDSLYTTDEYVEFVVRFMDTLGLQSATLCGNSMGGGIAWRTALKYPERVERLILVDSAGYPSNRSGLPFIMKLGSLPGMGKLFALFTTRGRIRASLESAYYDDSEVTADVVDAYYYPMRTPGAMHAVLARMRRHSEETEKWQARIPEIPVPTCIIWGAEDTWIPVEDAQRFHRDIEDSHLIIIPECGHLPQEEEPEKFTMHVLDFMAGRDGDMVVTAIRSPARYARMHAVHAT